MTGAAVFLRWDVPSEIIKAACSPGGNGEVSPLVSFALGVVLMAYIIAAVWLWLDRRKPPPKGGS